MQLNKDWEKKYKIWKSRNFEILRHYIQDIKIVKEIVDKLDNSLHFLVYKEEKWFEKLRELDRKKFQAGIEEGKRILKNELMEKMRKCKVYNWKDFSDIHNTREFKKNLFIEFGEVLELLRRESN